MLCKIKTKAIIHLHSLYHHSLENQSYGHLFQFHLYFLYVHLNKPYLKSFGFTANFEEF